MMCAFIHTSALSSLRACDHVCNSRSCIGLSPLGIQCQVAKIHIPLQNTQMGELVILHQKPSLTELISHRNALPACSAPSHTTRRPLALYQRMELYIQQWHPEYKWCDMLAWPTSWLGRYSHRRRHFLRVPRNRLYHSPSLPNLKPATPLSVSYES